MLIGINLLLFSGWPSVRDWDVVRALVSMGYQSIELPVVDPADHKWPTLGKLFRDEGITCTISGRLPLEMSLAGDSATAAKATDYHWRLIDCAKALGATQIAGPLAHGGRQLPDDVTPQVLEDRLANRIGYLAVPYKGANIRLALEPSPRYECCVINTCAAAAAIIAKTNAPWLGICADTLTMHIEEKSLDALDTVGSRLIQARATENDRGVLGTGQINWPTWAAALRRNAFDGDVIVNALAHYTPHLAAATHLWREVAPDPMEAAKASLAFLRQLLSPA